MSYVVVENFSAGLDTRRHPLTARPGTLQTLTNAHITRGGEIEKRKAFASFASLPSNTFGMEATSSTIYVFGSIATPTMPSGVTYQRLQHPDGLSMTGVVFSTLYGGKPFVIAKYSDGSVYPFFDGSIIADFVNGIARSSMGSLSGFATHMAAVVNASPNGYSAVAIGSTIVVTTPTGASSTGSVIATGSVTATAAKTQAGVSAVSEILASGQFIVAGGSASVNATGGETLRYIGATPGITGCYVGGREIMKLSSGTSITYTSQPPTSTAYDSGQRLAYAIAYYINLSTSINTGFTASYAYYGGGWSGNDPGGFIISSPATDPASYNGQEVWFEFASDPTGVGHIGELIDGTTVQASPHNAGRYYARCANPTMAGGSTNSVTSVKVDGVEILGAAVQWNGSNSQTMSDIVTQINAYASSPEYTADLYNGAVRLTALAGTGASPNGRYISAFVSGNVTVGSVAAFSGGRNYVAPVPEKWTYTLGGTFSAGSKVTLIATPTLDPANPFYWGATRVAQSVPTSAMTFKTKAHLTSGSSLFFSGVNQPTKWDSNGATDGAGSGFINMSNNFAGNETLTGLALYQGNLAVFARRSVQVWAIDPDPANNKQGQVISNTGALGPYSVVSVGEIDVFYLSDSGIRSLRARDASNAAVVNDVGTPVDQLLLADLSALTDAQKSACPAVIEPIDGRYWIAVGSKVYVYSYFPNSQVAAWSTYAPGFSISKFTVKDARIYARAADTIYLYGGTDNATYDSSAVEVILPYLDGGKPAHMKHFNGVDMTCEGTWGFEAGFDPTAPTARDQIMTVSAPTFGFGRIMAAGMGTHIGIRLTNAAAGYARVANLVAHFDLNEAD